MASFWKGRKYNLAKMSFREFLWAFATYPTVAAYVVLAAIGFGFAAHWYQSLPPLLIASVLVVVLYPLIEYTLHRWVLHAQWMYKSPLTATTWKRIHFDHHQDPHNLVVLFGAIHTTMPVIVLVAIPLGYAIGGLAGAATAFAVGNLVVTAYEFCHAAQHLNTAPRSRYIKRIKALHLAHHFHNETGNYGITSFFWDRWLGTHYGMPKNIAKSPTVFNLGYTEEMAQRYPWVANQSNATRGDGNPRRFRQSTAAEGPTD